MLSLQTMQTLHATQRAQAQSMSSLQLKPACCSLAASQAASLQPAMAVCSLAPSQARQVALLTGLLPDEARAKFSELGSDELVTPPKRPSLGFSSPGGPETAQKKEPAKQEEQAAQEEPAKQEELAKQEEQA